MKLLLVVACLTSLLSGIAAAQSDWPQKPVRVIVPFAPGGSNDAIARQFCEPFSQALGQQFVIDNKGGAGGAIGTEAAAKSPGDGYTLLVGPSAAFTVIPHLRKPPYTLDEMIPVARLGTYIAGLAAHPSLPANSMRELVALAKAKPGSISFASSGIGAVSHIRLEAFKLAAGVDLVHVPYRGSAEAINDLLAGHVQLQTENIVYPHVKAGRLKMLAMIYDQRHPDFPDVPTVAEAGYPEMNTPLWYGLFAPPGTPTGVVERLYAESMKLARTPDMQARLMSLGYAVGFETPAELREVLHREDALYEKIIREAKITNQ